MQLSIVIVNYNSGNLLKQCVESIFHSLGNMLNYEVIIYDNKSSDDSLERVNTVENLHSIKGPENLGFSKANNLGAATAKGSWIYFLNPDTLLTREVSNDLLRIVSGDPELVFVTPLMEKGQVVKSGFLIPTIGNYLAKLFSSNAKYWYLGASIIMHKKVYSEIGGWSNDFFMFAEDLDLCYRLQKRGKKIVMLHNPIHHVGGGTTRTVWNAFRRNLIIEGSAKQFYKRNGLLFDYFALFLPTVCYKLVTGQNDLKIYIAGFFKVNFDVNLIKESN